MTRPTSASDARRVRRNGTTGALSNEAARARLAGKDVDMSEPAEEVRRDEFLRQVDEEMTRIAVMDEGRYEAGSRLSRSVAPTLPIAQPTGSPRSTCPRPLLQSEPSRGWMRERG